MSDHAPPDAEILSAAVEKLDAAGNDGRLSAGALENARKWLTDSAFANYASKLVGLIDGGRFDEIDTLFWEVIPFGTGGRRGIMAELGSATINERTIAESAHGLAAYAKKNNPDKQLRAVVTSDTRNRSAEFAKLTATTFAAHGLKTFLFESCRSTPELSFAVRHLNCDVGAMISASHNPPADNGFKAYWSTGGQVLSPHDKGIIDCVYEAGEIPAIDFDEAVQSGKIEIVGEEIDRAYIEAVAAMSLSSNREVTAVFTPLHGVGETSISKVLAAVGFDKVEIFEPHREQNGDFPNVPDQLPNPERPEVFAPALDQAKSINADLILASDPDADRIAALVRHTDGDYRYMTGNRIGSLVVDHILRKRIENGSLSPEHYVVETLVTTPLIASLARGAGVRAIDDLLVGFKYIGETMDREGPEKFVFGAEESLGFLAGEYCRDKDAAIGALYLLEAATELKADGKTLWTRLDEISQEHGYHVEGQIAKVCKGSEGKQQIDALMTAFRETPPTEFGGFPLAAVRDYGDHEIRSLPDNARIDALPSPEGNLLFFDSAPGSLEYRIAVRPSGTEPKIKFYLFVKQDCDEAVELAATKTAAEDFMEQLKTDLSAWVDTQISDE